MPKPTARMTTDNSFVKAGLAVALFALLSLVIATNARAACFTIQSGDCSDNYCTYFWYNNCDYDVEYSYYCSNGAYPNCGSTWSTWSGANGEASGEYQCCPGSESDVTFRAVADFGDWEVAAGCDMVGENSESSGAAWWLLAGAALLTLFTAFCRKRGKRL